MRHSSLIFLVLSAVAMMVVQSCSAPKDVTYFQDLQPGVAVETSMPNEIKVMPDDRLNITVSSKDPSLASLFNLYAPTVRNSSSGSLSVQNRNNDNVGSYIVDAYGDIQFPILGTLHIGGMKRSQVSEYIQDELKKRNLVKDPIVNVDFLNHSIIVLGDVSRPGRVLFDKDRYTIVDALADAGDLSILGERKDVRVIRNENGRQTAYSVDLTDAQQTMTSPVYYLQQNDIIYVTPSDTHKRAKTANGNSPLTPSFWMSLASFATTMVLLIVK